MPYIDEETIKKIKDANDIVDVISSYIPLESRGKNYFGVCPFHDDHSPSMSVSPDKQIFRCFTCGTGGNVITFIEEYLKVSFTEALDILAKNAHMDLNLTKEEKISPYKEYYDIFKIATTYYKNNLNSSEGKEAREYLEKRKLDKETINYFDIGLSLNSGLTNSLTKKYSKESLEIIGLTNKVGNDVFRNRIMFAIKDNNGNVVGYSARKYKDNDEAKYVNTFDTIIFKKGSILYNFSNAKDEIRKKKEIIISEGQMEVIRMHTIGIDNAVALMGTSFTKDHLNIIKNLKCDVVLNLDQDEAGKKATIAIGDELLKNNINPKVIIFTGDKDADEYIVNKGKDAFIKAYNNKINYIDFKLNYLKSNKDLSSSLDLSKYINESIKAINELDDDILREIKINELSKEYNISIDLIKSKITNAAVKPVEKKKEIRRIRYDKYDISEIRILYLMMNHIEVIESYQNHMGYLNNPLRKKVASEIINYYNEHNKTFDISDFICYTSGRNELSETIESVITYQQSEEYTNNELEDYYLLVKEMKVKMRIDTLTNEMKSTLDSEEKIKLASKIENMKKEVLKWKTN